MSEINWQNLAQVSARIAEESFKIVRGQSFSFTFSFSTVTPGYEEPNTVEGSIVEPVTDPARLLPAKEVSE